MGFLQDTRRGAAGAISSTHLLHQVCACVDRRGRGPRGFSGRVSRAGDRSVAVLVGVRIPPGGLRPHVPGGMADATDPDSQRSYGVDPRRRCASAGARRRIRPRNHLPPGRRELHGDLHRFTWIRWHTRRARGHRVGPQSQRGVYRSDASRSLGDGERRAFADALAARHAPRRLDRFIALNTQWFGPRPSDYP